MQEQQYIDHFRIERALDSGAHGSVFVGVDERLERPVTIRTLSAPAGSEPGYQQTLAREAKAVSGLQHPNIVELYDFGIWQGNGYLVFEPLTGEPLSKRIEGEPMPVAQVLKAICDILDGLAHAHQAGVLHCDLRPASITLDADSNARVLDFGVWRWCHASGAEAQAASYLAPEVLGGEAATPASDIYSLGLVMFEMLTGRHPAAVSNDRGDPARSGGAYSAPSTLRPGVDATVDEIVLRALAATPSERFASATEMRAAVLVCVRALESPPGAAERNVPTFSRLLRKMQQNKDFPAFAGHIAEINRLTSAKSNATIVDLTNTVLKDFSLTTKLLRLVNSSMYCQFGGKITTVSRAITIIGFENIRTLAVGLLLFDHVRKRPNARDLIEVNLWSFTAAGIARGIADDVSSVDPEQAFIAALMARFGTLLAIYYLPDEYAEICRLMQEEGLDQNTASCAVLGLNLHTLGHMVAEHLHFPRLLIDVMQAPAEEKQAAPQDAHEKTLQMAGFAAQVGDILSSTDNPEPALRALVQNYEDALDLDHEGLHTLIDSNLREAMGLVEIPQEWVSGIEAKLNSLRAVAADPDGEPSDDEIAAVVEDVPPTRSDELIMGIDEITTMLIAGQALNDVLGTILEVAYRTLEVQRVVMFVNDMRTRRVAARFGIGAIDADLLKKLRFSLSERHYIHAAVERGEDVLVTSAAAEQHELPDWFRKHARAAACALLPIRLHDKLIGIIYADAALDRAIDDTRFQHLKTLRNQAALAVSAQRKR